MINANQIIKAAESNISIFEFAKNNAYDVRTVQLYVNDWFNRITYKRIQIHYSLAKTIMLIKRGETIQKAYYTATGCHNTTPYYLKLSELGLKKDSEQNRFVQAMGVIKKIANAKKPVTLKQLNCPRSIISYIRHTLGYALLSKPRAGYYFSSSKIDRKNCVKWINSWRTSIGIHKSYAF